MIIIICCQYMNYITQTSFYNVIQFNDAYDTICSIWILYHSSIFAQIESNCQLIDLDYVIHICYFELLISQSEFPSKQKATKYLLFWILYKSKAIDVILVQLNRKRFFFLENRPNPWFHVNSVATDFLKFRFWTVEWFKIDLL